MTFFNPRLAELCRKDPRYAYEAYEFVFQALNFTQKMLGRELPSEVDPDEPVDARHHVTGAELLEGARQLALREFGLMARVVFKLWGISRTDDFGEIVFNLVEAELMSKTSEDTREDFKGVFDMDKAFNGFRIQLDEAR